MYYSYLFLERRLISLTRNDFCFLKREVYLIKIHVSCHSKCFERRLVLFIADNTWQWKSSQNKVRHTLKLSCISNLKLNVETICI